jgi:hypothetical protein
MGILWELIEDAQKILPLLGPPKPPYIWDDLDDEFRLFTYVAYPNGTLYPGLATNYLKLRG